MQCWQHPQGDNYLACTVTNQFKRRAKSAILSDLKSARGSILDGSQQIQGQIRIQSLETSQGKLFISNHDLRRPIPFKMSTSEKVTKTRITLSTSTIRHSGILVSWCLLTLIETNTYVYDFKGRVT